MYDSTAEYNLNNAIESIKTAQQVHKRDIKEKDEIIEELQRKIEKHQREKREFADHLRKIGKENKDLLLENQFIKRELSIKQADLDSLREENNRLRQEMIARQDREMHLQDDLDKANHIIKTLFKRTQIKPSTMPLQPQPQRHI